MGGSIAVTVRRANGENIRMCRWTNPLPYFMKDARFLDGDETHLDEYLVQWNEMREDLKQNGTKPEPDYDADQEGWRKWADNFKLNMTSVYAPYPFLAPHSYGLVVFDYQTKTMLHCQGYTSFLEIFMSEFEERRAPTQADIDALPLLAHAKTQDDYTEEQIRLRQLFERGAVGVIPRSAKDYSEARKVPDIETARQIMKGTERSWAELFFFMHPDPWTVNRFQETREGLHEMKAAVLELGFKLSDHEEQLWDEFERERYDLEDA